MLFRKVVYNVNVTFICENPTSIIEDQCKMLGSKMLGLNFELVVHVVALYAITRVFQKSHKLTIKRSMVLFAMIIILHYIISSSTQ
jgi:hypothetical protein